MTVYNLGSINIDHLYGVPHLPRPGETIAAHTCETGLGGKGANQSVAVARAGSTAIHIGVVGADGRWALERIANYGVETKFIRTGETPTGHAIIYVDQRGENSIVIFSGANDRQAVDHIRDALAGAVQGDILLLQNETTLQPEAAIIAKERGMKVIYSAAPFSVEAIRNVLSDISVLMLNEVEAEQLCAGLATDLSNVPVQEMVITKGSRGADWLKPQAGETAHAAAHQVAAVDTTAAGDTFAGYFAAGLDQGLTIHDAMALGSAAAALKVTRHGTADAIPSRKEVDAFLSDRQT